MNSKIRHFYTVRSSHRRCFIRKVVLKNFAKFTGKDRCWSLYLIKLQARGSATPLTPLIWVVGRLIPPTQLVPPNNSKMVKAVSLAFCSILLDTFLPNAVCITRPSLQILGKTQTGVFPISGSLVNPLLKKIAIIPEPVMILTWKLDQ